MHFDFAGFAVWFLVFLFSTTCHEAAHAWAAYKGGDLTAYEGGQVTLDPLPHIRREPIGLIVAPILSFVQWHWMMGWASAPYDPRWGRQHPRRWALMALAGPMANLALALLALIVIKILVATGTFHIPTDAQLFSNVVEPVADVGPRSPLSALAMLLSVMLSLNTLLAVFNLLPVLPLDGASVLHGLFPNTLGRLYDSMRGVPMIELLGLVIAWSLSPHVSGPVFSVLEQLLQM
jgi:Zn-dependent protease